ncbi:MAG: pyruvate formate lyase activating enzyme, partial [Limisphaerales bacterium]
ETDVWFEVTTLLIPGENDSDEELQAAASWFRENLGPNVPWHFTAFHPDFRMRDKPDTPVATLQRARTIAKQNGLFHVYTGNVHDADSGSTWCPSCDELLIERDWYELGAYNLDGNRCGGCGEEISGRFGNEKGTWGRKRLSVRVG